MIGYLRGKIIAKGQGYIILEVQGIGYRVSVAPPLYAELAIGQPAEFYLHEHVREDALDLYGFKSMAEMEFFELLLSISGVGPKSALGIISIATPEEVKESIAQGDPHLLTKVSGIGKKTAERIVLELRDKIAYLSAPGRKEEAGQRGDEIDALMALGYSLGQAREALSGVGAEVKDSGERIRQALKKLGRK